MKPTNEEINRGIAEFMGYRIYSNHTWIPSQVMEFAKGYGQDIELIKNGIYTTSLDAQIPVFEKLGVCIEIKIDMSVKDERYWVSLVNIDCHVFEDGWYKSASEAAARAAYAAIMALKEEGSRWKK